MKQEQFRLPATAKPAPGRLLPGELSHRKRSAFTLIEILVVVAIIGILAAILFPVFARARENARRASCMNNMKQIAIGLQLYMESYDRRFPAQEEGGEGDAGWALELAEIIKNDAVFQCPSEENSWEEGFTDYWMNGNLLGVHESEIQQPANVLFAGDGDTNSVDYALPTNPVDYGEWEPDAEYTRRHLEGANYTFVDGHVKWLRAGAISKDAAPNGNNVTFKTN